MTIYRHWEIRLQMIYIICSVKFKIYFFGCYCIQVTRYTKHIHPRSFLIDALCWRSPVIKVIDTLVLCCISTMGVHSPSRNPSQLELRYWGHFVYEREYDTKKHRYGSFYMKSGAKTAKNLTRCMSSSAFTTKMYDQTEKQKRSKNEGINDKRKNYFKLRDLMWSPTRVDPWSTVIPALH